MKSVAKKLLKIEDFVFSNGYRLRLKHCGTDGLYIALEHEREDNSAVTMPQSEVSRLKKWMDKNYGAFF